jgi:hypothetical protein
LQTLQKKSGTGFAAPQNLQKGTSAFLTLDLSLTFSLASP